MKKFLVLILVMALGANVSFLHAQKKDNKVVCFKSNMDCSGCETTLTEHLKFEKGVKDLKVDHVSNTIMVEYKDGKNTDDGFVKAIEKKGYKAEKISMEQYKKIVETSHIEGHEHGAETHQEKK